ncbi:sigma factor G inhibitor Gin [Aureibacillus halotolerans]|uniref:Inhibitor of sigma-G Gin protein n=1 Tax=Aureibacillus halotolerans TaxID=1508390 RepID=A0A4R6TTM0_9BACI|nr:sigma factor G inhibitor Gin [Aureibacillus halotolerans]TDQ34254.1 inhibitor of sigma-G Gin protein [Aureibacillus halotolerans]
MEHSKDKSCVICEQTKDRGIYLYNRYICYDCEQVILQTQPEDEEYKTIVKKLKGLAHSTLSTSL